MNWIIILLFGFVLGWGVELAVDFLFRGRRNRRLIDQYRSCEGQHQDAARKLMESQKMLAWCTGRDKQYEACRTDLDLRNERLVRLEQLAKRLAAKLKKAQSRISQLTVRNNETNGSSC